MDTQPAHPQENLELRIRTMRTLWIAMFLSIGGYYLLTFFTTRAEEREPNASLFLIFLAIGVSTILISFVVKSKLLSRAIEQQQVPMVQQAYIVAFALTEVAAMLGLLDFFLGGSRYYYVLFIVAACGMLLHYPRREHIINAYPKSPIL